LSVIPQKYQVGDWAYCFNPRKFARRQDKWERKYCGPLLVVDTPSAVTVQLQHRKAAKPFTVHIDKVKPYFGETPESWLTEGRKEEAVENAVQTEQAERLSDTEGDTPMVDAEEQTAEETTPKGRDSSGKTGSSSADYAVGNTENRDKPQRGIRAPKYLGDYVR